MTFRLPSLRVQLVLLVSMITLIAALLLREFFINNLTDYQDQISGMATDELVRDLHREIAPTLDPVDQDVFDERIEGILRDLQKIQIAGEFYSRDIRRYSIGIVVLMVILTVSIFLLLLMVITRPLARLLSATDALKGDQFDIRVKETPYSPLNDLIVAFNSMVDDLNASRERLIEAEKQTIWQEMARAMAHEIKNPLTPIRLATQRLEMKYYERADNLEDVLEKSLRVVNEEVDNLQDLVTAFSGFAKMPEARPEDYDLNQQLQDITEQYSDEAQIQLTLDSSLSTIHADPMQMKQVLVNLIQNAIQACEKQAQVSVSTQASEGRCCIKITDQGKGISPDDLANIFEPYFTTKKKGTGLGLAIVRRIIRQHGGDIEAESQLGQGSTFRICLPCQMSSQSLSKQV